MIKSVDRSPLKVKLLFLAVSLLCLSIFVGALGQYSLVKMTEIVQFMQLRQTASDSAGDMVQGNSELLDSLWIGFLSYNERGLGKDSEVMKKISRKSVAVAEAVGEYISQPSITPAEIEIIKGINLGWAKVREDVDAVFKALESGGVKKEELGEKIGVISGKINELSSKIGALRSSVFDDIINSVLRTDKVKATNRLLSVVALVFILLVGVVCFFFVDRLSKRLKAVGENLQAAAAAVKGASKQILVTSEALSESTAEQGASVEQTVSAMEQMTAMVTKTSENAEGVLKYAGETQSDANSGSQALGELKRAIEEISTANRELLSITDVVKQIEEKTKVINDIVFETRLLSFNASMEAARAGEQGKGFAVVAEQIGNLVKVSGQAADEIQELLKKSAEQVKGAIGQTSDKVKVGRDITEGCSMVFERIIEKVNSLAPMVNIMVTALKEQESGIGQTKQAMQRLDSVASENTKGAADAAQAGASLERQFNTLVPVISGLNDLIFGTHSAGSATLASEEADGQTANGRLEAEPSFKSDDVSPS